MKMQEVRVKAKELGLKTGGMKKVDLIRAIQTEEGNPSKQRKGMFPVLKPKSMTVTRWIAVGEAIVRGGSAKIISYC
jgi:hypothetical protein